MTTCRHSEKHPAKMVLERALEAVETALDYQKARVEELIKDRDSLRDALAMVRKRVAS